MIYKEIYYLIIIQIDKLNIMVKYYNDIKVIIINFTSTTTLVNVVDI